MSAPPFVGRQKELAFLQAQVEDGRSVVLTGIFGIGRSALVRQLAGLMARERTFVFARLDQAPGHVWHELYAGLFPRKASRHRREQPPVQWTRYRVLHERPESRRRHVIVLDDVVRLSTARLDLVRRLHERFQMITIAEDFLPAAERDALCAALWVRAPLRLGHLEAFASLEFFERAFREHQLTLDPGEVHGLARAVRGFPLGMQEALAAELRRRGRLHRHLSPP